MFTKKFKKRSRFKEMVMITLEGKEEQTRMEKLFEEICLEKGAEHLLEEVKINTL